MGTALRALAVSPTVIAFAGLTAAVAGAQQLYEYYASSTEEVKATNDIRASELEDVRRRLDRHDVLFDRLFERQQKP